MGRVTQWLGRVNAMTVRERAIILAALAAAVGYFWYAVLLSPLDHSRAQLHSRISADQGRIHDLEQQIDRLGAGGNFGPAARRQARLAALRGDLERMDRRLRELTGGLIAPSQMTKVLQQMLARDDALTLVSVESIAPKPLIKGDDVPTQVYVRGLRLTFRGGYLDTLAYLKSVEALPWHLFWSGIQYDVKDYPEADATLVVYTLSTEKGWIGV